MSNTIKRNSKCYCGSGKKFKHCCLKKHRDLRHRVRNGESPDEIKAKQLLGEE